MDEDARGKRREERYGHDERRFHGHGQTVSSILPNNHAFHAGWSWMIRQSRTLGRLGNINIAAAHCRRALRRSQSTMMSWCRQN